MESKAGKAERYSGIDGLRTFSVVAIACMHVLANSSYQLDGFVFENLIPSFADFVYLFMMVSGFSLCCGYYDRIASGAITPEQFYSRRLSKIWPFFAVVTVLDVAVSPTLEALYEAFANLTLCFGLLPNPRISVIGVGWTLGVIFVFYLLFPFFCYLMSDKRRAWLAFVVAVIYNILCKAYFFDETHMPENFSGRVNILYCAVYFVAGGLIYCYRKKLGPIASRFRCLLLTLIAGGMAGYFLLNEKMFAMVILFSLMLIYAIGRGEEKGVLNNRVTSFISSVSLELYLCHMVVLRVLQKLKVTTLFLSDLLNFTVTVLMTVCGSVVFAICARWAIRKTAHWCEKIAEWK